MVAKRQFTSDMTLEEANKLHKCLRALIAQKRRQLEVLVSTGLEYDGIPHPGNKNLGRAQDGDGGGERT